MLVRYARLICLESSPRPQPPLPLIPHTMAVQPLLLEAVPQTISFSVRGCLLILDTLLKTKSCPDLLDIINMNGIFPCLFATIIFKVRGIMFVTPTSVIQVFERSQILCSL
ncbi:hypothetical protein VPH35_018943 [Triticum aestivum]